MRLQLSLSLMLITSFAISEGIVCSPGICEGVSCESAPTVEQCEGELIPNSSFCGCCPTCVIYLAEGEACPFQINGVMGVPPPPYRKECDKELKCVEGSCRPLAEYNKLK